MKPIYLAFIVALGALTACTQHEPRLIHHTDIVQKEGGATFIRDASIENHPTERAGAAFRQKDFRDVLFDEHLGANAKTLNAPSENTQTLNPKNEPVRDNIPHQKRASQDKKGSGHHPLDHSIYRNKLNR